MIKKARVNNYLDSQGIILSSSTILLLVQLLSQLNSNYGNHVSAYQPHELYTEKDDLIRLNDSNFASHVFHPNNSATYMVEFYNTYCGHCQAFAPVYKDLGSRVKNWTNVARVAVLDCARDENVNICADNKVMGYPTIYFFPPRSHKEDPINTLVDYRSLHYDWTVDGLEEALVDYLYNLTSSQRPYPQALNALIPIEVTNLRDITSIYNKTTIHHDDVVNEPQKRDFMIMVEAHDSYMGRKLIVDYTRIGERLELRRVLLNNTALLNQLLQDSDFKKIDDIQPLLLKLNGDLRKPSSIEVLVRGDFKNTLPSAELFERIDYVYDRFRSFFEHYYSVELRHEDAVFKSVGDTLKKPAIVSNKIDDIPSLKDSNISNPPVHLLEKGLIDKKKVFALDLLKSISYMINHEILIKGDLTPTQYNIVRNLLAMLKKFLPLDRWNSETYKFIVEMRTRLDYSREQYEKIGIKRQELRDIVTLAGGDSLRENFKKSDWATCHASQLRDKGYTCSLWVLFHTLSLGELFKAPPVSSRPKLVLTTMRDYITTFFGCTVCSTNFARETKDMEESLTERNSSVLWLWKTHNFVNERLNNEKNEAERKTIAQVIYPRYEQCPRCYKVKPNDNIKRFLDFQWDLPNVLQFMIDIYKPESIVTDVEVAKIYGKWMRKKIINAQMDGVYIENMNNHHNSGDIIRLPLMGLDGDEQLSVDPKQQSIFSTGDISIWIILYFASILIVVIVCISLNPRWKRYKTM